jgi:hypothetical protein
MSEEAAPVRRRSAERAAREERLGKALRDNLRRRKDQARARQAPLRPEAGDAEGEMTASAVRLERSGRLQ